MLVFKYIVYPGSWISEEGFGKVYAKDSQTSIKTILLKVEPGFRRKGLEKFMLKVLELVLKQYC